MFLGVIFVEKLPVLFDARGVHDNFCQDCSLDRFLLKYFGYVDPTFFAILTVLKASSKVVGFCLTNKFSYLIFTFFV